jgi:uncharacterized membrane protein YdjX (TVP38/TMEM64 family)
MKKHAVLKKILLFMIIASIILGIRLSVLGDYLTFENLKQNREHLHVFVSEHYLLSVLLYILIYIIVTGISLPGATTMTLAGGFLFGTFLAAVFVNIGATIGATMAFLVSRYLLGSWIQNRYHDKLEKFNNEIEMNGYRYLLTLRFIALFPFYLINLLTGVTKIPLKTFIWTTSVGIFPGSLVYAFAGSRLNFIESPKDIFSLQILIAFLLLALLPLLPVAIKKLKHAETR